MRFPNAHNGVKKIFTAEILSLIGTVTLIIAAILALATGAMVETGTADAAVNATMGMAAGFAIFGLVGSILILVAFIMNLVGILSARKDEGLFSTALAFTIIGIAVSVLAGIFSKNELFGDFAQIITTFAEMMVAYYVVQGIMNLAVRLQNTEMYERGNQVRKYLMIAYCVPIIIHFISTILSMNTDSVLAEGLALFASVVTLVVYVIYLGYLSKAKKMLEE